MPSSPASLLPGAALACATLLTAGGAQARVLMVGAGQEFAAPSAAARVAAAGDVVRILPGSYYDCAVWNADRLVIEGAGPGVVLTDTACQGKASFVIRGSGVTVRDLAFVRIRVPDGNGAGIRAEGPDLTVVRVRFENDQEGLLAASLPGGTLRIEDCVFTADGTTEGSRTPAALAVGAMDRLVVRNTTFTAGKAGAAIVSDAALTEIIASRIDAAASGQAATVEVNGGLRLEGTTLTAGRVRDGQRAAVLALPAGAGDAPLTLHGNRLEGGGILLLNWSGRPAALAANEAGASGVETSTAGAWSYRLRRALRENYTMLHDAAHQLAHDVLALVGAR